MEYTPQELMVAKVREAVRARRDPDFVIIARTNGVRQTGMDDAIGRARAYRDAGADMIYIGARTPDEARRIATELPPPFMMSLPGHGATAAGLPLAELGALGFSILASSISAYAFHRAMKRSYERLGRGELHRVEPRPDAALVAEGPEPAFGRDPGAGQHEEPHRPAPSPAGGGCACGTSGVRLGDGSPSGIGRRLLV